MKKIITRGCIGAVALAVGLAAWGDAPASAPAAKTAPAAAAAPTAGLSRHEILRRQIEELKKRPAVRELPPYLDPSVDFGEACEKAGAGGKRIVVSLGREACGRCQLFYERVRRGVIAYDPTNTVLIRLNVDVPEQREYFLGTFNPPDAHLPFVGVTDGARMQTSACLSGTHAPEEYVAEVK